MAQFELGYGQAKIAFGYDESRFRVLEADNTDEKPLSDVEINESLDAPVDAPILEEVIEAGDTVLLVVPDATRAAASGQVVNLLVRRLIANGVMPHDIRVIFATGIHRKVTEAEKRELLTPFIAQRIKTLDHQPRDLMQITKLGQTSNGIPIELNRALLEHDKIILIGGVTFHYFAGFTGARKLICPGLASSRTVNETHKLNFDFAQKTRRAGVEAGKLSGNPVHEIFIEIAEKIAPALAVNTIVDEYGNAVKIFAGHWRTAHEKACQYYARTHSVTIAEKRPLVIVSSGGAPLDINLIQAHKALEMASHACAEDGTIIWLAECPDGIGRNDFLNWFEAENSVKLAENLIEKFQVNGQTAWSLLNKAERFRVILVSNLPENEARQMRLHPAQNFTEALANIDSGQSGYILPVGAKFLPVNEFSS
jgi:nickel-dependent lactate racemase